jgi:serine/threonine protein kinase
MEGNAIDGVRILRLIGEGGCGIIYEGLDLATGGKVAFKMLHPRNQDNSSEAKRLVNEGSLGLRLRNHPHVIRTIRVGKHRGLPFIVQELAPGRTVRSRVSGGKTLPEIDILRIADAMGQALTYIHENSIFHKDVKPDNIIMDDKGSIKLIDLGTAETRLSVRLSFFGRRLEGSPSYMAPELITSKVPSEATDRYALGCTLYECATGEKPFESYNEQETLRNQADLNVRLKPTQVLRPDLMPETAAIIESLLEKNLSQRCPSCALLLNQVARHPLFGGSRSGTPISRVTQARSRVLRG